MAAFFVGGVVLLVLSFAGKAPAEHGSALQWAER